MAHFLYKSGFALGPGRCRVLAQSADLAAEDIAATLVLTWDDRRIVGGLRLAWIATRLAAAPGDGEVYIAGPGGVVATWHGDRLDHEVIDGSDDGPPGHGEIRDLRWVGKALYAAGMNRQVYRRVPGEPWRRHDAACLGDPKELEVFGFNAIDGVTEDDLYAVGFAGEIWHCRDGKWRAADSPTNVILHRVRAAGPREIYAAGQMGVVLRGHDDVWDFLEHDLTEDDLWGMEWFQGRLYLASKSGLFRVDGDTLEKVDTGLGAGRTYAHLHSGGGALWSFGPLHLAWTTDGEHWHDVVPD